VGQPPRTTLKLKAPQVRDKKKKAGKTISHPGMKKKMLPEMNASEPIKAVCPDDRSFYLEVALSKLCQLLTPGFWNL